MPRKTVGLGPANDSDTTKLYRPPGLRWFDSGAFDWDPSRPLREQWPWSGDPDDRVIRAGAPEAIGMTPRQMRARQAEADRIEDEIRAEAGRAAAPVTDPAALLASVRECTPSELDADQPPADVAAAVERIAEMADEPEASEP